MPTPSPPSADLLLELVESAPDALVVTDAAGAIVLVNRQAEQMFGYPRSQMLGQPVELLVPEPLRDRHAGHRLSFLREPGTRPMGAGLDLSARHRDGTEFPVEVSLSPARTGDRVLVSSAIRDVSERRRMQQALRESEQRFAAFFRNSATPFAITEVESGAYLDANEAFCRLLGWSRSELLGWSAVQLGILPDARARSDILAGLGQQASGSHEARLRTRDGRQLDVLVTMTRIGSGGQECIASSLVDMTESLRAREAIEHALRRVDEAERATRRGSWEWDVEADRARWSPGMYALLGVDPATFDNRNENFLALIHPDDRDRMAQAMAQALAGPGRFYQEYRLVRPDGAVLHLRGEGDVVADPGGRPRLMYGFVQDVTQGKRAEEAVRESQQSFTAFFRESVVPLAIVRERDGALTEVNDAYCRLVGRPRGQLLGRTYADIGVVWEGDGMRQVAQEMERTGQVHAREFRFRTGDGEAREVLAAASRIRFGGEPCFATAAIDITDRKQAERALAERTRELEQANRELDAFAYSVSHDLRAPLRAMSGFAQILLEEHAAQLSPQARHCVDMVVEGAREMDALVDDLLRLSRLTRQPLALREVDLGELARKAVGLQREAMAGRDLQVEVLPMPRARADPALLQQAYANLVGNAVKFTSKRPRARVEVGWDAGRRAFYVRDDGVGFDMRHAGRLFGAFQRLHRAEEYPGTGIGLAIVHRVVSRHGGRVWAEAEPDRGATFLFTLPEVLGG